jgi:hypothetical protein
MESAEFTTVSFAPVNHLGSFHAFDPNHHLSNLRMFDIAAGLEVLCAMLTILYIGSLLWQGCSLRNPLDIASGVIKTSLQGQRVNRRLR